MEKLKEKHMKDLEDLDEHIRSSIKGKYKKRSREIIDMQKQIETLVSVNKFEEAEKVKYMLEM